MSKSGSGLELLTQGKLGHVSTTRAKDDGISSHPFDDGSGDPFEVRFRKLVCFEGVFPVMLAAAAETG